MARVLSCSIEMAIGLAKGFPGFKIDVADRPRLRECDAPPGVALFPVNGEGPMLVAWDGKRKIAPMFTDRRGYDMFVKLLTKEDEREEDDDE